MNIVSNIELPYDVAMQNSKSAFKIGMLDTLPLQMGVAPFALIFGTLAGPAGLSPWATMAMSVLVYAGSSQFLALSLLAVGAALPVIIFTTLIINLRHALYSATLQPPFAHLPFWRRACLAFFLTDETFAVVQSAASRKITPLDSVMLGSGLVNFSTWIVFTGIGIVLGNNIPQLQHWGLEFAMVATFTGIVVPLLVSRAQVLCAVVAGTTALLAHGLPYKLGLLLAVLLGVWAAMRFKEKA
ncbi:AzlC family ABC transporter permease [Deefgea salmonis]|uniref:AzlC family ABC transporter permease n=1 Tax=Deefgea salmonis TaxID=2875502 RepID=A0ABS8BJC0_9NEIS|nr:AzlC family ABC transporter permease [Deefgea salmonis]MCB5195812.1 AzlC family ABC transporter permease [Deefgea salmonis]